MDQAACGGCSNNGMCDQFNQQCICFRLYSGSHCEDESALESPLFYPLAAVRIAVEVLAVTYAVLRIRKLRLEGLRLYQAGHADTRVIAHVCAAIAQASMALQRCTSPFQSPITFAAPVPLGMLFWMTDIITSFLSIASLTFMAMLWWRVARRRPLRVRRKAVPNLLRLYLLVSLCVCIVQVALPLSGFPKWSHSITSWMFYPQLVTVIIVCGVITARELKTQVRAMRDVNAVTSLENARRSIHMYLSAFVVLFILFALFPGVIRQGWVAVTPVQERLFVNAWHMLARTFANFTVNWCGTTVLVQAVFCGVTSDRSGLETEFQDKFWTRRASKALMWPVRRVSISSSVSPGRSSTRTRTLSTVTEEVSQSTNENSAEDSLDVTTLVVPDGRTRPSREQLSSVWLAGRARRQSKRRHSNISTMAVCPPQPRDPSPARLSPSPREDDTATIPGSVNA